jgi:hypothetical protein
MSNDTSKPVRSLSPLAWDYLKEEQKQRRQKIENLICRIESDQRNGLLFTGAIWAWLATNVDKLSGKPAMWIVILRPCSWDSFTTVGKRSPRLSSILQDTREN